MSSISSRRTDSGVAPKSGLVAVDRVKHRPRSRHRRRTLAREPQVVHPVELHLLLRDLGADERDADRGFEDLVASLVAHSQHQRRHAVHRADDRVLREGDARRRPRELREDEARGHRRDDETRDRFDDHDRVRSGARRIHGAVADGPHRLDAEAERVPKRSEAGVRDAAGDEVPDREDGVEREVRHDDDRDGDHQRTLRNR